MFLPKQMSPVLLSANRALLLSGTQADVQSGAALATFHSVRAASLVPRPACGRDHNSSASTARQSPPPATGQHAVLPARVERRSTGPGSAVVSPRSAVPRLPIQVPRLRQFAAIPASLPEAQTPGG